MREDTDETRCISCAVYACSVRSMKQFRVNLHNADLSMEQCHLATEQGVNVLMKQININPAITVWSWDGLSMQPASLTSLLWYPLLIPCEEIDL